MSFALTATVTVDCPEAQVSTLVGALLAGVPTDVTGASGEITEQSPSTVAGNFLVTATLAATVSQGDIGNLVSAAEAALTAAGITLVSGTLAWK